jgi:hypothetical protein
MGGYGSGRTKRHDLTNEYISIDLAALHTFLSSEQHSIVATCTETRGEQREQHQLALSITRYRSGEDDAGLFVRWDAIGHATVRYEESGEVQIPLVTTRPHYGGVRYWFLAPCCGRRSRVLYLTPYDGFCSVQCRVCLDLHYASQQQSVIERHITYEKYLLERYGYTWARLKYQGLSKHYFKITPEYAEKKARSELTMQLRLIRRLMSFNRLMLKDHIRAFRSLRSEADRRLYLDGLHEWGTYHMLLILEQSKGHLYAENEEIETLIAIIAGQPLPARDYTYDLPQLMVLKEQIEEELEAMAA